MSSEIRMSKNMKDDNKSVNVEEVQNGYIVTVNRDYKDSKDEWQYETKKYISKTNPLDKKAEDTDDSMSDLGDSFDKLFNNLSL